METVIMKRRRTGVIPALAAGMVMALLAGCGNAIPDMTEEQQKMVTEYAAQLLLKYDANYQSSILTEEESRKIEEDMIRDAELEALIRDQQAQQQEEEKTDDGGNGGDGSTEPAEPVYTDVDSFLGLSDAVDIEYAGYLVCESYPEGTGANDWQGVARATSSNSRLVVFTFQIRNISGSDYLLDMASMGAKFSFQINGDIRKSSLTTLLLNDLIMYRNTIPAGESADAVLLIEMPVADTENIKSINMIMKLGDRRAETTLL